MHSTYTTSIRRVLAAIPVQFFLHNGGSMYVAFGSHGGISGHSVTRRGVKTLVGKIGHIHRTAHVQPRYRVCIWPCVLSRKGG